MKPTATCLLLTVYLATLIAAVPAPAPASASPSAALSSSVALGNGLDPAARERARHELAQLVPELRRQARAAALVHELVAPSVVSVHTREQVLDPFSRRNSLREVEVGEGSGFIVHSTATQSFILTNAHVVVQILPDQSFARDRNDLPLGYDRVRIVLSDSRSADAAYAGVDPKTDLALLRIDIGDLPAISWGDSDAVRVGDQVLALGYPLGIGASTTFGNISATDRSTGVYRAMEGYEAFLQTDAAINPGNSGGPLVGIDAKVIGVNANIVSRTGANIGLGFAIPANLAQRVAEDLLRYGRVLRPMIGVGVDTIASDQAAALGLPEHPAVRLGHVIPGGPADRAGLKPGDVLLRLGGVAISNDAQFRARIASRRIGEAVALTVWRGGRALDLQVTPVSADELTPQLSAAASVGTDPREAILAHLGLRLTDDDQPGLIIAAVSPNSPAARSGLTAGDRVLGERRLGLFAALGDAAPLANARSATLLIERAGTRRWALLSAK